jgi:hypothetical protein
MVGVASLTADEVALGVFTHRTTYLPGLLGSLRKIGAPSCVVVCADGPINTNMERLWRALQRTKARYWVFLDDDIEWVHSKLVRLHHTAPVSEAALSGVR